MANYVIAKGAMIIVDAINAITKLLLFVTANVFAVGVKPTATLVANYVTVMISPTILMMPPAIPWVTLLNFAFLHFDYFLHTKKFNYYLMASIAYYPIDYISEWSFHILDDKVLSTPSKC